MRIERIERINQVQHWRFQQHKPISEFFVQKAVWVENHQRFYGHIFPPFENYISDFYEHFNQKLSDYNVKSFLDGYLGAYPTNFSSLITIPLNFGHEHWELLWDHVIETSSDFKPALINCAKLIIYNTGKTSWSQSSFEAKFK